MPGSFQENRCLSYGEYSGLDNDCSKIDGQSMPLISLNLRQNHLKEIDTNLKFVTARVRSLFKYKYHVHHNF